MATRPTWSLVVARIAGGVALLVVGGIHLEQYTAGHFSVVPTIGTLFLVNFVAATASACGCWSPSGAGTGRCDWPWTAPCRSRESGSLAVR